MYKADQYIHSAGKHFKFAQKETSHSFVYSGTFSIPTIRMHNVGIAVNIVIYAVQAFIILQV